MSIMNTRALLDAGLRGDLHRDGMEYEVHPIFKLRMPKSCPGVDPKILSPRNTWGDQNAYDMAATKLSHMFQENFQKNGFAGFGIEAVM